VAQHEQERGPLAGSQEKEVVVSHGFATDVDYDEELRVAARHRHDRIYREEEDRSNRGLFAAVAGLVVAAALGAAIAAYRRQGDRPTDAYGNLEIDENDRLISSSKVENTAVFSRSGERLGTLKNFMVDKYSGQVRYAVLSFGGLLSMGERHYPLPWDVLTYDESKGGYVVNVDKEDLSGAPSYEAGDEPAFDTVYRRQVLLFYR